MTNDGLKHLMSVHAPSGAIRWSRNVWGVNSAENNILIEDNGTLIASFAKNEGDTHHLHRIDPDNGNVLWSSAGESAPSVRWMGPDGVVYEYYGLYYGLHRFDMQSGERARFFSDLFGNQIGSINNQNQLLMVMSTNDYGDYPKLRTINMDGSEEWRVEKEFHPNEKLYFKNVDVAFVKRYANWMTKTKGNSNTTVGIYLRCLRTLYNKAIRSGFRR